MILQYTKALPGQTSTTIQATLLEGEQLGNHAGPIVMYIPEDGGNAEYADIIKQGLTIQPAPA